MQVSKVRVVVVAIPLAILVNAEEAKKAHNVFECVCLEYPVVYFRGELAGALPVSPEIWGRKAQFACRRDPPKFC